VAHGGTDRVRVVDVGLLLLLLMHLAALMVSVPLHRAEVLVHWHLVSVLHDLTKQIVNTGLLVLQILEWLVVESRAILVVEVETSKSMVHHLLMLLVVESTTLHFRVLVGLAGSRQVGSR